MDSLPTARQQHAPTRGLSAGQQGYSSTTQVNLEHASGCSDPQCPLPVCVNLKMASIHARRCAQKACDTCYQVKLIRLYHVKSCRRDSSCPVPLCLETKVEQQYVKLTRELSGEVIVLNDTDSSLPPSGDSTSRHTRAAAGGRFTSAKRTESWEVQLDDVNATPQKLPRYEGTRSLDLTKSSPPKVVQRRRSSSFGLQKNAAQGVVLLPKPHKPFQSNPVADSTQKPANPVLQVLQKLMQVLALSQTCEEEAVMVSLLESTVREARAKITSFKKDQMDKLKQGHFSGFTDITKGALQEQPQHTTSSFDNRCPSPDFIRELFE